MNVICLYEKKAGKMTKIGLLTSAYEAISVKRDVFPKIEQYT